MTVNNKPAGPRAVTVRTQSVGMHLTLVINPLRDDKE